MTLGVRVKTFV